MNVNYKHASYYTEMQWSHHMIKGEYKSEQESSSEKLQYKKAQKRENKK